MAGARVMNTLQSLISSWPLKFKEGQGLDYAEENTPYSEFLGCNEAEGEKLVERFMPDPDDPIDVCNIQIEKAVRFCPRATLAALEREKLKPVAWLDEGCFTKDGRWLSRKRSDPLTAYGLLMELNEPRYKLRTSSILNGHSGLYLSSSAPSNPSDMSEDNPDAERRLVFVTDLDEWSIYALISKVSQNQAFALRSAIFRYLAYETLIGATITVKGLWRFRLEFHLPYYAWRQSDNPIQDPREYADKDPLRDTRDVSFLHWDIWNTGPAHLSEAQISCVVAGIDNSRWEAYCFVETYFEPDESKESVLEYYEEANGAEGMYQDPLTKGKVDAGTPTADPRWYFLQVFCVRLHQVKGEWQRVVENVYQSTRRYSKFKHNAVPLSQPQRSFEDAERHNRSLQENLSYCKNAMQLSQDLLQTLSKTVSACKRFVADHATTSQNPFESENDLRSIPAILQTLQELEALKETLEGVAKRCESFTRDVSLYP